jgi:hypothetical protein
MVLNLSAGQEGLPGPPEESYFDFVVAERPVYIPGSGPPLAPITIMPPHDKKGIIIDEMKLGDSKDSWRYIVTYDNEPTLRLSIKPERIRNYVSARTYEKYMADKEAMANLSAKDLRRLQREQEKPFLSRPAKRGSRPAKRGKKRQHVDATKEETAGSQLSTPHAGLAQSPVVHQPGSAGRKRKLEDPKEPTFASPHLQRSRIPSFSSPSKQRGLAELVPSESEEENDDTITTEAALRRQLNEDETDDTVMDDAFDDTLATEAALERQFDENMRRQTGFLSLRISSPSTSPERTETKARVEVFIKPNKPRSAEDSMDQTRSFSISTSNNNDNTPRQRNRPTSASVQPRRDSVASLSSREAAMVYEDLEKKKKARKGSIAERHSRFFSKSPDGIASKSTPKPKKSATPPTKKRKASASPSALEDEVDAIPVGDDENDEYEVEDILDDEWRDDKDSKDGRTLYYLIKWVGDWDNTWEPAVNVGSDVRADYEKKRRAERLRKEREERSMSHDSRRGANGKPKAKSHAPTLQYDSEEESLFLPGRPRARSVVVSNGRGKGKGKGKEIEMPPPPKRGEVIDDDDAGDSD